MSAGNVANDADCRFHATEPATSQLGRQALAIALFREQSDGMSRQLINDICARFSGAEHSDPWGDGHDVWKVGGRIFACAGAKGGGVSVKCPDVESAELLIEMGLAERAPYFHRSWVRIPWQIADEEELAHRLRNSYATIRSRLPRKVQAQLAPLE